MNKDENNKRLAAWLDVDYDDREICEAMVVQIADALNTAADKDRQIAVLTEALGHYGNKDTWAPSAPVTNDMDDRDYDQLIKDFYLNDGHGYDIAAEALAKSQRIQEGE